MKEDFLHYLWKYQKLAISNLETTEGDTIQILKVGSHNTESHGPDFLTAQILIGNQKWAGNVEIHLKSSDWYAHNHHKDTNYDSVILHVVWEYDVDVYRENNTNIATLELRKYVDQKTLIGYKELYSKKDKSWINCEKQLKDVNYFILNNWLERLYFERLEEKCKPITELLHCNKNNWEETCFCLLAKAFGGNRNGDAFFRVAQSIPFLVIQKEVSVFRLEALLFGQANLLDEETNDYYQLKLFEEYSYLKNKYKLIPLEGLKVQFFKIRPSNFPTIRLSQLANLYANKNNLFSQLNKSVSLLSFKNILKAQASEYWDCHYNFGKESKSNKKKLTETFINLLLLNSILPLRFLHIKYKGDSEQALENLISIVLLLAPERNNIITGYKNVGIKVTSALTSQSILTLYKNYCLKNRCLNCAVGSNILNSCT